VAIFYATCHNLGPLVLIIIDAENWYSKDKIIFKLKTPHSAMCEILMDGWKLVTSTWRYGCSYSGVA
jgi:hypothetical protein